MAISYTVRVVLQYKQKKRLYTSTFFWIIFWTAVTALAFLPDKISLPLAKLLGIKNNVNAVIFVALLFMFSIVFYLSAVVEKMERQITELVRKLALENKNENITDDSK